MIRKSLAFLMVAAVGSGTALAQTPEPKPKVDSQVFTWTSDGGYLGVQTEEITRGNLSRFGLKEVRGVGISKVVEGSPAQAAGLQDGDVIVRVNGEEITSSRKLTRLISEISPEHTVKLTVARGGAEREVNVTLGKRPMPQWGEGSFNMPEFFEKLEMPEVPQFKFEMPEVPNFKFEMRELPNLDKLPRIESLPDLEHFRGQPFVFGARRQIGVSVTPLTKQLSDHFGVTNGALVNNVRENSAAAKAGLKAGDIITEIDGKAVKGDLDIVRALTEKKEGEVTLTIVRDRNRQTLRLTPEQGKGNWENYLEYEPAPEAPGTPATPGVRRLDRTQPPAGPMPLNQLFIPGRVV